MGTPKKGFTTVELALVVVIIGVVTAIALPKFAAAQRQGEFSSARQVVGAYLSTARAAAIQRGTRARFVRSGNAVSVTVETGGGAQVVIRKSVDLTNDYRVSIDSATTDTVTFDSRGFAMALPLGGARYVLARDGTNDRICVSRTGLITPRGCS